MSRESEWIEATLHREFPEYVEFREGSRSNHVIVEWEIIGPDDAPRRNAPFVIIIDPAAIDRYEHGNQREQARIKAVVCEIVRRRINDYDPHGPVCVPEPFVVEIEEGDL